MPKFEVHADADNVLVEFDKVICIQRQKGRGGCPVKAATISVIARRLPQIDKQIFNFERPVLGEGHFNSAAGGPAEFSIILEWQAGQGSFYIRAGPAGSPVHENAVPRVADARTERSQPIARGLAAQSPRRGSSSGGSKDAGAKSTAAGAADALPIKIAFDT